MSYNFDKIQDTNFCCIYGLVDDILTQVLENKKFITVIADADLTEDLIQIFMNIKKEDNIFFNFKLIELDTETYDKEYYFSVLPDNEIYIEKGFHEANKNHESRYFKTDCDITYIYADCKSKVLQDLDDGVSNILIFGFGEE